MVRNWVTFRSEFKSLQFSDTQGKSTESLHSVKPKYSQHFYLHSFQTCIGSKITSDRVKFLRRVTFVETVAIAVSDLSSDLHFIERYLSLTH